MTRMIRVWGTLALLAWLSACGRTDRASSSAASRGVDRALVRPDNALAGAWRPMVLPDLSSMPAGVREQVRDAYATATASTRQTSAPGGWEVTAYGRLGMLLMAANALEAAEPSLLNAEKAAPKDARWPHLLGELNRRLGKPQESARWFARAIELEPLNLAARVRLAEAELTLGRTDEAEAMLQAARGIDSRSAAVSAVFGRVALARGDYPAAVRSLEEALAVAPDASVLHYPLAMAYRGLHDQRAVDAHLRLRGESPVPLADAVVGQLEQVLDSAMPYETRGVEAMVDGDWDEAAASFLKGLELAGANRSLQSVLHQQLGVVLYQQGDTQSARQQFEEAVRLAPESANTRFSLGIVLAAAGELQAAIEQLSAAVRDDPSYVEARLKLAGVLKRAGRTRDAREQYDEAVKIDPRVAKRVEVKRYAKPSAD